MCTKEAQASTYTDSLTSWKKRRILLLKDDKPSQLWNVSFRFARWKPVSRNTNFAKGKNYFFCVILSSREMWTKETRVSWWRISALLHLLQQKVAKIVAKCCLQSWSCDNVWMFRWHAKLRKLFPSLRQNGVFTHYLAMRCQATIFWT